MINVRKPGQKSATNVTQACSTIATTQCLTIAKPDFAIGEVCWARIRGHPFWPAKIERIYGKSNQMVEVWWFNDYRRTRMLKAHLKPFLSNYDELKKTFENHIGLETAVKEAVIYSVNKHF